MADYKIAILITIDASHEGGFQNNPSDSGNWTGGKIGVGELKGTKYGISAHEFPNLDIEHLTPDQAVQIYQEKYWSPIYTQISDQLIANKLFDCSVLFGPGHAVGILQSTLSIKIDEDFGPVTLAAVNAADPVSLLRAYKTALVSYALAVGQAHVNDAAFVAGWIRRINS